MRDYIPVAPTDVRDESLDLVTNFIGFHHAPLDKLEPFARSFQRVLRKGGRMIVRDHDVDSPAMSRMVALAHDVFNLGLKTDWAPNQQEVRYFTSIAQLAAFLEKIGFTADGRTLFQDGDPTKNALMVFAKA
jgi:SAM-dependent methyltransferase